jgi:hypothetical protein
MAKKNGLIAAIDGLPKIVKIILCFFGLDVVWSIYRIIKYAEPFDLVMMVISIVMLIGSFTIGWILDLLCVILKGKPFLG